MRRVILGFLVVAGAALLLVARGGRQSRPGPPLDPKPSEASTKPDVGAVKIQEPSSPTSPRAEALLHLGVRLSETEEPPDFGGVILTQSGPVPFQSSVLESTGTVPIALPAGPALLFVRTYGEGASCSLRYVDVGAGSSELGITLPAGASLSGTVVTPSGSPAADVRLVAVLPPESAPPGGLALLGKGSARVEGETALIGGPGASGLVQTAPVVVSAEGAQIETWSDAEGKFRFEGLPARPLHVRMQARRSSLPPQEVAAVPGARAVTFTLSGP